MVLLKIGTIQVMLITIQGYFKNQEIPACASFANEYISNFKSIVSIVINHSVYIFKIQTMMYAVVNTIPEYSTRKKRGKKFFPTAQGHSSSSIRDAFILAIYIG